MTTTPYSAEQHPTVSIGYDIDKDSGEYFVLVRVTGLKTEQQAIAATAFVEQQLCGKEIVAS